MSGENSCFSRFLVKFVEVSAAGLATAISAYALAHLGGLLSSSPTPTSAPATVVQVSPTASEVAEGLRAKPTPAAAAAVVNKQSPAPQQDTDATVARPARKAANDAKAFPPRKHTKTDTSVAEKEPRGQTSAEALARAALANVDANRPAPNNALIEPGLADTHSAPVDIQPRRADVPPRQADVGPPPPVAVPPALPVSFSRRRSSSPAPSPLSRSSRGRSSASTRRRVPAKSRVRPCRSGRLRLTSGLLETTNPFCGIRHGKHDSSSAPPSRVIVPI
jgi:hypothetical protein